MRIQLSVNASDEEKYYRLNVHTFNCNFRSLRFSARRFLCCFALPVSRNRHGHLGCMLISTCWCWSLLSCYEVTSKKTRRAHGSIGTEEII